MNRFFLLITFLVSASAIAGDETVCSYLPNSPAAVVLDETGLCMDGKPKSRYFCVGSIVCQKNGFKPKYNTVMCPMPDRGCESLTAKECGLAKNVGYEIKPLAEIDLDEVRKYKRDVADKEKAAPHAEVQTSSTQSMFNH